MPMRAAPAHAETPRVIADIAPVHSLVAAVMGDVASPDLLLPQRADPHAFQMRPSQMRALSQADLVFWVALGLGINLATIADLGFTLASALMFACVSRCFGSKRPIADFGVGFVLAAISYLGFSVGLGINIGEGILEKLVF